MPNDHSEPVDESRVPAQAPDSGRRAFMLFGAGFLLAGCASHRATVTLPAPPWDAVPAIEPAPVAARPAAPAASTSGVITRAQWAAGPPVPSLMNRMLPVRYVTVHHDGMTPFYGNDPAASAQRLELIRRAHRERGWGDIGYHWAIDRSGRVWEGRPVQWQGAHVKDHNEGNLGVVCLGNFDRQQPTEQQVAALDRHLAMLMQRYQVPMGRLRTHQEWAPTACPGRNLQRHVVTVRKR